MIAYIYFRVLHTFRRIVSHDSNFYVINHSYTNVFINFRSWKNSQESEIKILRVQSHLQTTDQIYIFCII